ncbi:MAG: zinc-finger domain-containing protein [Acidiphilium sp.]|jgi:uncharacterized Zn-finger protein
MSQPSIANPPDAPGHAGQGSQPIEIITVTQRTVSCDGGVGPLGHPRVYLRIESDHIDCPYCTRRYTLSEHAA